jgi:beta-phosphoglucomutase-like phosphatase (HAD superfamily)
VKRCDILKISGDAFKAVIFDLDGVVTDTATLHSVAWKKMFDVFLEEKGLQENKAYAPFDEIDYLEHVDGKPRYDGIIDFCLPEVSGFLLEIRKILRIMKLFMD